MKEFRKLKSLKYLYEINECGVLRNVKSKKIVTGYRENNGYQRVRIENKCLGGVIRTSIHQLVAEAFLPNPEGLPEVNHIDTNKQNNHVSNLEWTDHIRNMKHAYANGINRKPLLDHSKATRAAVTNGKQSFISISDAAKWLVEQGKARTLRSAIAGISAVVNGKRHTLGGYEWKRI